MSSSDELSNASDAPEDLGSEIDDLFGDGDSNAEQERPKRTLNDEELDSGDDLDRDDRMEADYFRSESPEEEVKDLNIVTTILPRHPVPEPSDNELYLLKIPPFLSLEPTMWQPQNFQPPKTEHHSKRPPTSNFNAYNTAMSTIRWRHSPSMAAELQSNARILRWSDGSLTLQMATDPTAQFQIQAKPLGQPQANPPKPVPLQANTVKGPKVNGNATGYDASRDTFTYLAEPSEQAYVIRVTRKFTTALDVKPNVKTESLESLQASMAAATAKYQATFAGLEDGGAAALIATGGSMIKIEDIRDDPEKLKKEALRQEREQERKKRKEEREKEKNMRTGRGFGARGTGVGLSLDELEGGGGGRSRPRGAPRARRSRRDEFSEEEEEMYGRRGGPDDQYDMDDGFIAGDSEEDDESGESEDAEGEEDIDDVIERQERERAMQRKGVPGGASPKRPRDDDATESDAPRRASAASPVSRSKRRRVVSDDDEDD